MLKIFSVFLLAVSCLYSASSDPKFAIKEGAAPPAEVSAGVRAALPDTSMDIRNAAGDTQLELWFAKAPLPAGKEESGATLTAPHGAFVGLVRVGKNVNDRRGDRIAPGLYVLRLSFHPIDGSHQGIAPQRDFLILTKPALDTDPAAQPAFADLMKLATQTSGTNHPLSLSCWKQDQDFSPGLHVEGEGDTVLQVRVGNLQLAVIISGTHGG